jgi:hypothetical protein
MAKTIMECWDIMQNPTHEFFGGGSGLAIRLFEYLSGNAELTRQGASGRSQTGHVFGQSNIDAWQAKNSKIRNDESVEAQSLKNFRDNNL